MTTLDNPYGIFDPKHWTNAKKKHRPSMYQMTLGNPYLRSVATEMLFGQLQSAKSAAHKKFIAMQLRSLGQEDYLEADNGEAPKGAE